MFMGGVFREYVTLRGFSAFTMSVGGGLKNITMAMSPSYNRPRGAVCYFARVASTTAIEDCGNIYP